MSQSANALGVVTLHTNTIVELSAGMHVNENGQWTDANPAIIPSPDGATGEGARHSVWFANNLNSFASIRIRTDEDELVNANVLGLGYYDTNSGRSVLIAKVKDCTGTILNTNQVLYADAFAGLSADVKYTYTAAGFEQDVVLRQCPPAPETLGLKSENVSLYVVTELVNSTSPQPFTSKRLMQVLNDRVTPEVLNSITNQPASLNSRPTETDKRVSRAQPIPGKGKRQELLKVGGMLLAPGKAFETGTNLSNQLNGNNLSAQGLPEKRKTPVHTQWFQSEGRSFLLEQVQFNEVRQQLRKLPGTAATATAPISGGLDALQKVLTTFVPPASLSPPHTSRQMLLASTTDTRPGFVLDYNLIVSGSELVDYEFDYSTTYVLGSSCFFSGTTYIREGAIIKVTGDGALNVLGALVCPEWDLAYITSIEDDTVGEPTAQGTGPYPGCYSFGIKLNGSYNQPYQIQNLQISYAWAGVYIYELSPQTHALNNCHFNECYCLFQLENTRMQASQCSFSASGHHDAVLAGSLYTFTGSGVSFSLAGWDSFAFDYESFNTGVSPQSAVRLIGCDIYASDGVSSPTSTYGPVVVLLDPPVVTVEATDPAAVKGTPDKATLTFRRTGDTSQPLVVAFNVGGTASPGVDYTALPQGITIPQGDATATMEVLAGAQNYYGSPRCTVRITVDEGLLYTTSSHSAATIAITDPSVPVPPAALLNINFGGSTPSKLGFAATGLTEGDFWNDFTAGTYQSWTYMTNLAWSDQSRDGVGIILSNAPGAWGLQSGDPMYNSYRYPWNGQSITVTITNLSAGPYDFYCYGHGDALEQSSRFQITSSGTTTPWKETERSVTAQTSSDWQENVQYVLFQGVSVSSGQPVTVTVAPGGSSYAVLNGMQIVSTHPQPSIVSQPQNQYVVAGAAATFSVSAAGKAALIYSWRLNDSTLTGATASSYSMASASVSQAGLYSVIVSNAFGMVESTPASLTVVPVDWFTRYWGANYQNNPNAALGANPDGDAYNNLQEYLRSLNPLSAGTVPDVNSLIGLRVFTPLK